MIPNEYWCYSWMCKHVNIKLLQCMSMLCLERVQLILLIILIFFCPVAKLCRCWNWTPLIYEAQKHPAQFCCWWSHKARNVQWSESVASLLQISVLMGEPYFSTSLLPWHSLFFWYCRTALAGLLRPNATILPCSATLHMVAVEFQVRQRGIFSYI